MRILLTVILGVLFVSVFAQSRDRADWVDFGGDHTNKWLQIAPNKMGPNALPVPPMDYGLVDSISILEIGVHSHFMSGDKAYNSFFNLEWSVVPKKVMVKIWGYPSETFNMSNEVRDERQIYHDDTGWITMAGDVLISTFIQIIKDHKTIPDIVLNYSNKTTTGDVAHARYTDTPANYFYVAFGKSYSKKGFFNEVRIGIVGGFYVWQINKVKMAQNEGPLYQLGIELKRNGFSFKNEIGGYNAYDAHKHLGIRGDNEPLVYRINLSNINKKLGWKFEFLTGLNDYQYNTFKCSVIYKLK